MLGFGAIGSFAIGQLPKVSFITIFATLSGGSVLSGFPTANYKQILSEPTRKIIFAAEISPWTLS